MFTFPEKFQYNIFVRSKGVQCVIRSLVMLEFNDVADLMIDKLMIQPYTDKYSFLKLWMK